MKIKKFDQINENKKMSFSESFNTYIISPDNKVISKIG
jgi:hypothetical protein